MAGDEDIREAHARGDYHRAATLAIRGYGPELLGYLAAVLGDGASAEEVFSDVCADLWRGLPAFEWRSSLRTWLYRIARHRWTRYAKRRARRRIDPLSAHGSFAGEIDRVRTKTRPHLRSESKSAIARLRERLEPEERELLILRVDRDLGWNEIAEAHGAADLDRHAAALRKRFERVKEKLKKLAVAEGLLAAEGS
jgi:RNA polymerase sigma-70 factor (ECF subfamily)